MAVHSEQSPPSPRPGRRAGWPATPSPLRPSLFSPPPNPTDHTGLPEDTAQRESRESRGLYTCYSSRQEAPFRLPACLTSHPPGLGPMHLPRAAPPRTTSQPGWLPKTIFLWGCLFSLLPIGLPDHMDAPCQPLGERGLGRSCCIDRGRWMEDWCWPGPAFLSPRWCCWTWAVGGGGREPEAKASGQQ